MIVEHKPDYPIAILNEERYNYYLDCEKKSKLTDKEIREEALRMFKEWTTNTDLKIEISMRSLLDTFKYSRKTSFFTEWCKTRWYGDKCHTIKEMECPRFIFEKSLNDAVNAFISEAYKEHRKELEDEFNSRVSRRAKSYARMRKLAIGQWVVIAILLLLIFII